MKKAKFNFIPERLLNKSDDQNHSLFTVAIYNSGQIVFSEEIINVYEWENKFIRFFADMETKAVGWSILEGTVNSDNSSDLRQVIKEPKTGACKLSIKKVLKALNYEVTERIKMPIGLYKSAMNAQDIYYVTLPDKEAVVSLNGEVQE